MCLRWMTNFRGRESLYCDKEGGVKKPPIEIVSEDSLLASIEIGKANEGVHDFAKYFSLPIPPFPQRIAQEALHEKVAKHIERLKEKHF
ncbi:hypothetical protein HAX54_052112, partial [Datura stramonium]|nr:hypothetical protein [Datura stramonium]